jgi:hypothetical protein
MLSSCVTLLERNFNSASRQGLMPGVRPSVPVLQSSEGPLCSFAQNGLLAKWRNGMFTKFTMPPRESLRMRCHCSLARLPAGPRIHRTLQRLRQQPRVRQYAGSRARTTVPPGRRTARQTRRRRRAPVQPSVDPTPPSTTSRRRRQVG